jgi:hypothetical protein
MRPPPPLLCFGIRLTSYRDDLQIFTPFVNLPSRSLLDYYQVIKRPVSLKSIAKRIRGIHGRTPATGLTDFHTWAAFEEEVSYIWKNARTYNEDGSEMFNLAADFEVSMCAFGMKDS